MRIGIPKEIKNNEFRVATTPDIVHELTTHGHEVYIETHAGIGSGFTNEEYSRAGACIVDTAQEIFAQAELILKVKEPQHSERQLLNESHTLFTYLHLAPDTSQTDELIASRSTCIAYETVEDSLGKLPLLTPMSEIAGRMAIQAGAHCLEKTQHGRGLLLSGAPGVAPANVLILGGGVVGKNAAKIAIGMGANVTIMDKSLQTLRNLEDLFGNDLRTLYSNRGAVLSSIEKADLIVGAVLIPGGSAPKLITKADLSLMQPGAVIVDVAIDQGGCIETSVATTHENPTFLVDQIVHYCVANMPGAVARTSTLALTNATLPYVLQLANQGVKAALGGDNGFLKGLNIVKGKLCNLEVATAQNKKATGLREALELL